MCPVVPPLHESGLAVRLIDAHCHGHSDREAFTSMPRFAEDIAAGLTWLKHQPEIDSDNLALLGHSVGAAACLLHASRHHDVRAVVNLSAFAHPREVMRGFMAEKRVPYPVLGWSVMRSGWWREVAAFLRTASAERSPAADGVPMSPCCPSRSVRLHFPWRHGCCCWPFGSPPGWQRSCRLGRIRMRNILKVPTLRATPSSLRQASVF